MFRIVLLRHGESEWNRENRFTGWTDVGLSERGGRISYLVNREFPYYQLGSLYRSADCFVSAGRGEGWDMPLMEAMACGLASIATDWGAHTEFADDRICYPLKVRGTKASPGPTRTPGTCASCCATSTTTKRKPARSAPAPPST